MRTCLFLIALIFMGVAPASAVPLTGTITGTLAPASDPGNNQLWLSPTAIVGPGVEFIRPGSLEFWVDFDNIGSNLLTVTINQPPLHGLAPVIMTFRATYPFLIKGASLLSDDFPVTPVVSVDAGVLEINTEGIAYEQYARTHTATINLVVTPLPEPMSILLFGAGVCLLQNFRRKKQPT